MTASYVLTTRSSRRAWSTNVRGLNSRRRTGVVTPPLGRPTWHVLASACGTASSGGLWGRPTTSRRRQSPTVVVRDLWQMKPWALPQGPGKFGV